MNTLRTIILMGFMTALMVAVGGILGGKSGVVIAFVMALATNFFGYWFSDSLALKMADAQPVSREEAPELYEIVEGLATRAGIPVPRIYIAPTESPNAFATGRDPEHSAVAVTAGILRILNRRELEGVLAHEFAHVKNRDILTTSIASVFASAITMLVHFGMYGFGGNRDRENGVNPIFAVALMILAPIAATLLNLAISRSREFEADHTGAGICGHPEALASALGKLTAGTQQIPMNANPAMANMYIVKPDAASFVTNLMSTHPPLEERIRRLEEMAIHNHTM